VSYNKPELQLVGAARTLVLGGPPHMNAYDNATRELDFTDKLVW
jgi:hypothetical protein